MWEIEKLWNCGSETKEKPKSLHKRQKQIMWAVKKKKSFQVLTTTLQKEKDEKVINVVSFKSGLWDIKERMKNSSMQIFSSKH